MALKTILVAVTAALLMATPSQAVTFTFFQPGADIATNCVLTAGGDCAPDASGVLEFSDGGINIGASAFSNDGTASPLQDLVGDFGGLGAVSEEAPADNIQFSEGVDIFTPGLSQVLVLTTGIFYDTDHGPGVTQAAGADFNLTWDGGSQDFALTDDGIIDFGGLASTQFIFQSLQGGDPFYISQLELATTAIPEPGTALLLGLGLFGLASRRVARA